MKITALSPHRDDAAFSLGLSIGRWLEAGHAVEVMNCFTRSEYSPYGDTDFVHENDLRSYVTAKRLKEDVRWSRQYGRPITLSDLNLRDAPQRLQCAVDDVCVRPVDASDAAIPKIRRALERGARDALVAPLGIGRHVDHLTARMAALDGGWPGELALALFEDLPYAARGNAAEEIEEQAQELGLGLEAWFAGEAGYVEAGNVEARVARKRQLALCYDSQIDSETTEQIARFCERYGGRERIWVNGAWREAFR